MNLQDKFARLESTIADRIIGQEYLVDRLLVALLCDGHLLVEGAPGLAKTRAIKVLSEGLGGDFHRVQFTPDLLPADLTGTDVYRPRTGDFEFQPGPLFHNLVLADEINRAPAKVQSALLEAMAERQITVGSQTYSLPELFLVMATQNPVEQEGTFALPEAQLDRFLLYLRIDYPSLEEERRILRLVRDEARGGGEPADPVPRLAAEDIFAARRAVLDVHLADSLEDYILQLVQATRDPGRWDPELSALVEFGAGPRASLALDRAARAHAWLAGRDYVIPEDIRVLAHDVLRHRIVLGIEAEVEGTGADAIIDRLLKRVPVA